MKFTLILSAIFLVSESHAAFVDTFLSIHNKIDEGLDLAGSKIQKVIESAKAKANGHIEDLKKDAIKISEKSVENIHKVAFEVKEAAEQIIIDAGGNASECKALTASVDKLAHDASISMNNCVTEKLELGRGYVDSMFQLTDQLQKNLSSIRVEAHNCMENVNGLATAGKALICVNLAGAKAAWISLKSFPTYTTKIVLFTYLISTLEHKLPLCAAVNGYNRFIENSNRIVDDVQKCTQKKNAVL